ncbi:MAG: EAL domain-containing protein [Pseudomonadales bacterium]|nr:EAL domain-containing protein [Pseudomonadales bacterium]
MLVLIVDDDEVDYLSVKKILLQAFRTDQIETHWIRDPAAIDLVVELQRYDICFIDQNIGQLSGIDIIRRVTERGNITPMVLLTGVDDQQIDKKASEYGASDYLTKDELTPQLLNRVIRFSLAQKEHAKKLTKLAYTDGLTGLYNRIKFDQSLSFALSTVHRTNTFLALLIIDLDNFKSINDNYGHQAGDKVLADISQRLQRAVRKSDLVARLGGDEFAVVFTCYKHEEDILALKDKILAVFTDPISFEQQSLFCQASIGISVVTPQQSAPSVSEVVREADNALYQIKGQGKNACLFFNPLMRDALAKAADLERALTQAITNNELYLNFQPKVTVSDHKICGAEALLRWRNADGENIAPDTFIPVAERSRCILEIGRWVIEQTCRQMRDWLNQGIQIVPIAVNISPLQIEEQGFAAHILQTLEKYDISPHLLELEITETALMQNLCHVTESLNDLAQLGCRWSIDDFGTGYSSLSRLNVLPITKIKIDRSFIVDIETSKSSQKICNIIIALANTLDLTVVVEGIETLEQLHSLPLSSSDELQGYLFSRPLSAEALVTYLAENK